MKNDKFMMIKIVTSTTFINIISAYAPQAGFIYNDKKSFFFLDLMNEIIQDIHNSKSFIKMER